MLCLRRAKYPTRKQTSKRCNTARRMQLPAGTRVGEYLVPGVMRRNQSYLPNGWRRPRELRQPHNPVVIRMRIADDAGDTLRRSAGE
jgi:hypothetical protein